MEIFEKDFNINLIMLIDLKTKAIIIDLIEHWFKKENKVKS